MKPYRTTGIAVGLLFLTATVTFYVGHMLILGILDAPDALARAAAEASGLTTGALLMFVDAVAVVAIAFLLYPLLRRYSEPLAVGYVGMRVAEFAAILLIMAAPLLFVPLSVASASAEVAMTAASSDASTMEPLLAVARGQYRAGMTLLFLCVGTAGTILAWVLTRSRLVPRPLALLGLVGYLAMLLGTALEMFALLDLQQGIGLFLVWPVGLFEVVLPIWLMVKGFNTESATDGRQLRQSSAHRTTAHPG